MSTDPSFCANYVWWAAFQSGAFWASIGCVVVILAFVIGHATGNEARKRDTSERADSG